MHSVILLLVIVQLPRTIVQSGHGQLPAPTHQTPIYRHESMSHSNRILSHRSVQVHKVENNWDQDDETGINEPVNKHPNEPAHSPSQSHPPPTPPASHSPSAAHFPPSLHPSSPSHTPPPHSPAAAHSSKSSHASTPPHSPPHHASSHSPSTTHSPRVHTSTTTHSPPHHASHPPPHVHSTTHSPPHHASSHSLSTTHSPPHHSPSNTHSPPHHASPPTHPPPSSHSPPPTPHPPKPSTTPGYDCDKRRYNCTGPGLFSDSTDHTIFFRCRFKPEKNRYRPTCFTCNWKFQKCFNKHVNACIPCNQANLQKDQVPELLSQKTSYDCSGYEAFACSQLGFGLHEHPGDKSISVHCTNDTGEWLGGCITCPRNKFSCFIEGLGQCVENCADNQKHTYDCSHYKVDPNIPCKEKGKYGMIGRSTTYFECEESADGSGKILPTCKPCPKDEYFDKFNKECTSKPYEKEDSSTKTLEGRLEKPKDKEDNSREALEGRRAKPERSRLAIPRFTTVLHQYKGYGYSLRPNPEKVFITSPFMSYDCKKVSYTCVAQGLFVNPMDPSVWFQCTMDRKINQWKPRCRECPKHTCFDLEKRQCVNTCMRIDQSLFEKCRDKWTEKCDKLLSMGK